MTETAFDVGYESLSAFSQGCRTIFGQPPGAIGTRNVINITRLTTRLGPMYACATEQGICLLEFTERRMLENEFRDLCRRLDAVILPGEHPHFEQLQEELEAYLEGRLTEFTVPLHTPGTEFQQEVWRALRMIPYGETRSYREQAEAVGRPRAVRAVAAANGQNRVAMIIPCHRVIGSDGRLVGYAGGLARKKWLLELERTHAGKVSQQTSVFE